MGFHEFRLEDATSLGNPPAKKTCSEAALSLMQEVAEKVNRVMHAGYVKARPRVVMVLVTSGHRDDGIGEDFCSPIFDGRSYF